MSDTKPVNVEELAIENVHNLLLARARARRDLTHAIHSFCLRYDLMNWLEKCRADPAWWWPEGRKTLVEQFKKAYGIS